MTIQFVQYTPLNDNAPAVSIPANQFADHVWESFDFGDVVWVDTPAADASLALFLGIRGSVAYVQGCTGAEARDWEDA